MVQFVACHDEGDCAHGDLVFIGHASPHPRLLGKRPEKCNGGVAHVPEFFGEARERTLAKSTGAHVVILLEARQGSRVVARKS